MTVNIFLFVFYFIFSYRMDKEISELNSSILEDIKQMFDEYNSYAKLYRMVRDKLETNDMSNMKLRIIGKIGCDGRRHIFVQHLMLRLLLLEILMLLISIGT